MHNAQDALFHSMKFEWIPSIYKHFLFFSGHQLQARGKLLFIARPFLVYCIYFMPNCLSFKYFQACHNSKWLVTYQQRDRKEKKNKTTINNNSTIHAAVTEETKNHYKQCLSPGQCAPPRWGKRNKHAFWKEQVLFPLMFIINHHSKDSVNNTLPQSPGACSTVLLLLQLDELSKPHAVKETSLKRYNSRRFANSPNL